MKLPWPIRALVFMVGWAWLAAFVTATAGLAVFVVSQFATKL